MRALCLDFERRDVRVAEIGEPREPGAGEALLRLHEVGVCATDRELARFKFGEPPAGESLLALGHEALAWVERCGPGVEGIRAGDWVVPMIRRACTPACAACAQGRFDLCRTGGYAERGITRAHGYFTSRATDPAGALIRVPEKLLDVAVLAEPLSVVEKAVEAGMRAHPLEPRRACVVGAGPVGLLSAMALQVRGFAVDAVSLEAEDDPRVRLLRLAGVAYKRFAADAKYDLVLEASGAEGAAAAALDWLDPCGVLVLIGAPEGALPVPGVKMLVDNLTVTGIVNAARKHFDAAFADMAAMPSNWLHAMIERRSELEWRDSLAAPTSSPKTVHRIESR